MLHVLHAIHDFPPRHQAGSELYALELARAQAARHHVTVMCAEYDPARPHGLVSWRLYQGLPVVELINNWVCATFEETYRPPLIAERIRHVLDTLRPDVIHVHNLLNLSFDLPAIARERGVPVVATLHDYTLVCASGGQRVHKGERHVCHDIDTTRCARCFTESPFYSQAMFGNLMVPGTASRLLGRTAAAARRAWPAAVSRAASAARHLRTLAVSAADLDDRMEAARRVFADVDLFVAPSAAIGLEFERLGMPRDRIRVSDYGMPPLAAVPRRLPNGPLRVGFVGTLVWHKGVHVLIEAIAALPSDRVVLKIFGDTATFPDYAAELRERAASWPVTFMGAFERDRAADVYAQIDVLVVPSLWPENSPLVIHEAFVAGIPIVAARVGGIPGLVTDGVNGLLYDASSATELAGALRRLIDDPSLVAALAAGAPAVKSVAQDADEWDVVYRELAPRGRRS